MKELIINADDFGLSVGANRAIIKAWREGILTSTSLMVGGGAFAEAVALAKENPGLQVGLHLTLVQGRALLGGGESSSLADQQGDFADNPVYAGMRYFFAKGLRGALYREIEAQIVKFRETGIPLSHIDGHLNIHMHPVVFDILQELMPRHGIKSFRLSRERLGPDLALAPRRRTGKAVDAFIFSRLACRCKPALERLGIAHAIEVKGLLNSGSMTEEYLLGALDILQDGLTEIYFHPGVHPDEELRRRMPDYRHEEELAALTSPRVKEKMMRLGIVLLNYWGERKKI
ncbi:MAG TPA: hopanoid biosynthesis-associated protein HpnK [Geobacteraceae bacterium]|nr:hopanoid biosynthesis-associated protein HpnK [Geobacteraceae bacterium]